MAAEKAKIIADRAGRFPELKSVFYKNVTSLAYWMQDYKDDVAIFGEI